MKRSTHPRSQRALRETPKQRGIIDQQRDASASVIEWEAALPVSLLRAREAVMQHMRPILRAHGFTEQQWRVLRKLDRSRPIDKTMLASRATLLMPSLLRILKDLQALDLIELLASKQNSRLVRVVLSAKGAKAVAKTTIAIEAVGRRVREHLGCARTDALLALLHAVEVEMKDFSVEEESRSPQRDVFEKGDIQPRSRKDGG